MREPVRWAEPQHHPPPSVATMVDLLRHRAAAHPDRPLYTFLEDGEERAVTWTFAEVDRRARAVAVALREVLEPGDRALLIYPPGLDYMAALYGCMYARVLAVPAHPPDPARLARTVPRLRALAEDAGIRAVLTHSSLDAVRAALPASLGAVAWMPTDLLDPAGAHRWSPPDLAPGDLAYLQYTSGSTSAPKGVMVTHANLLHQLADFNEGYGHTPHSTTVTWLPSFHDLGLVYGFFQPLFIGFHGVSFAPLAFMQRPIRWLRAIDRYRATHSPAPNFAFDLCVTKTTPADRDGLDLSCWQVALNGAEPIRRDTERRFLEAYAPYGFRRSTLSHAFGMSETTAKVTSEHVGMPDVFVTLDPGELERNRAVAVPDGTPGAPVVAGCGVTAGDTRVVIADPQTRAHLPPDRVGEVWVGGRTVGAGYWNNAAATEHTFRARLAGSDDGPFLRTGDLGFVRDGHLFLTGRLKDMIIIRGQNHYPQDLEWTIQDRHPALRPNCAAAFSVTRDGEERLVLVTEVYPDRVDDPEAVFGAIRDAVLDHGLQAWALLLIAPRTLPKTSSGKIRRTRARELYETGGYTPVATWQAAAPRPSTGAVDLRGRLARAPARRRVTLVHDHARALAASLLGVSPEDLESDRPLRELGFDSVTAVELVDRLGRDTGIDFAASVVFDFPTLDDIAAHVLDVIERGA